MHLTSQQRDHYKEQGFVVIPHLFSTATITLMREHYMKRRAEGPKPGDTLFFDGKVIHGSYMIKTNDRWRRSFICHYMGENSQRFEPAEGTHVSHLKK